MDTPYVIHRIDEVASTQDEARRRHAEGEATVVLAGRQVAGRGRTGNEWIHAPRASAASVAIAPFWPESAFGLVPLLAGMAARHAIRDELGATIDLKWPNDLMVAGSKVGGVLVEAADGVIVAGCGINLWWPDPPSGMGGVVQRDPGAEAASRLAETWAVRFIRSIDGGPSSWDRNAYTAACETVGLDLEWDPAGRGRAVGVAADGGLIVATASGQKTLRSGTVRTVRPATLHSSESPESGAGPT
jgi:BirA family biotin operon repressor/biotin-[acetyl-CoA-carboxylase] ligase